MKKLVLLFAASVLALSVSACKTDESALRDSSSMQLSSKEVKDIFVGNTVTAVDGKTFYFDRSGVVVGKSAYGEAVRGNWNVTQEGQLCLSNWNASFAPSSCYKVYFDNASQHRKLVDVNGSNQFTVTNILTGNPNNF